MRWLLYHNFRILYRLSRWIGGRLSPAGAVLGGGLLGAAVFGLDTRQTLAFQVAALLACLLATAIVCSLRFRPGLRIERLLPAQATSGQPCRYRLRIHNPGRKLQRDLLLRDELASPLPTLAQFRAAREGAGRQRNWFDRVVGYPRWVESIRQRRGADTQVLALPDIAPGDTITVSVTITPCRRGHLRFTSVKLMRPDPLGLVYAVCTAALPASLLCLPERFAVPALVASGRRRYQPGGESLASAVGDSQEFASLREYRPGDPMRHVHWRSFARTGKPVVKEFMDEFFDRNALVLDPGQVDTDPAAFEDAVRIAASFADARQGRDALLDLLFIGSGAERFTAGRALAGALQMLEVLACVQAGAGRFDTLAALVRRHVGSLSGVIFVLLDWDPARQALVQAVRAHGLPVRVFLVAADTAVPGPGPHAADGQLVRITPGTAREALLRLPESAGTGARAA